MIEEKTILKLEYKRLMKMVAEYAISPTAKSLLENFEPSTDFEEIARFLHETSEALELTNKCVFPDFNFDDLSDTIQRAKILSPLSLREILSVMRLLRTSRITASMLLSQNFDELPFLTGFASGLYQNRGLEDKIDTSIVNDDELSDSASEELFSLRKKINKANADIKDKLNSLIKSSTMSKYFQDCIVTIRNDRYVLPVKQEYKANVQGLIHDQSATGATVFVEPISVVNLNNQLKELLLAEKAEIEKIIAAFTASIAQIGDYLLRNQEILAYLDSVYAKAMFATKQKCLLPKLNSKGYIFIKNGRHPLLDKTKVVPISIAFGDINNLVIVTGPNTGGKTVSLKTVGLFCLMAYTGLYLPTSDDTNIAVFDNIFCDIGDEQSIEQNLSTFSSHITNINYILKNISKNTLVLIDEVGAGTEPIEGSALALAVSEYIFKSKAKGVITTHYSQLKEYSITTPGVVSASMEFDPKTFAPTFKLVMGVPGSSNAIEIAKRLGMREEIIDYALSKVSDDKKNFDLVLRNAESLRQEYEAKINELQELKSETVKELDKAKNQNKILMQEREKLLSSSRIEAKRIVSSAKEDADNLLTELKEIIKRQNLEEKALFEARSLIKKLDNKKYDKQDEEEINSLFEGSPIDINTLQMGDKVYIKKLNTIATVVGLPKGNKIEVKFNNMLTQIKNGDAYSFVDVHDDSTTKKEPKIKSSVHLASGYSSEINLLGQTVDEALLNVDKFIDDAVMHSAETVRIIHGRGTGKLKAAIHSYLKTNKSVAEYRLGNYNEGDGGVTIVTLK